jgi:phosphoribosylamine--glycine ligase
MKVLIIGGGGREHALAWKMAQSSQVECVYVAPGNAGTAREAKCRNVPIGAEDVVRLRGFAVGEDVDLTVVGPEAPLVDGLVDTFAAAGLLCFGPRREAAILEGSKAFTKEFLVRHRIPTAAHASFTDPVAAVAYLRDQALPIVIKADGLAAGKGVVIATTLAEAEQTVHDMLEGNAFGAAGSRVVIEEFLQGEEASFIVIADGEHVLPMASSQDHKRLLDGDQGPNTGGMGAYSPAPVVTGAVHDRIMEQVIHPTLKGMAAEGRRYTGFLYAGVMVTPDGVPKVLEFNCRFGDPEAQPIMMRLKSDLFAVCLAAARGDLEEARLEWDPRPALGVVLAAEGYPGTVRKGAAIAGLEAADGAASKVFHAGTIERDGEVVVAGGRVLCVCALGDTIAAARDRAYARVETVRWPGMQYRRDIGHHALSQR